MEKKDIIALVIACAKKYKETFVGKNLAIIYDKNKLEYIETSFSKSNFLHLTGVNTSLSAKSFYSKCINNSLSLNDISRKNDGTTELKLQILPSLLSVNKHYKMIGTYNDSKPLLVTDRLVGGEICCIGFIKSGDFYIPNTALKGDIRDLLNSWSQIIAVISKPIKEVKYTQILYKAKNIDLDIDIVLEKINQRISVEID